MFSILQNAYLDADLLFGVLVRVTALDANLKDVIVAHVQEVSIHLILRSGDVAQFVIFVKDHYGVAIMHIIFLADEVQRCADFQFTKHFAAFVMRKPSNVKIRDTALLLFVRERGVHRVFCRCHSSTFFKIRCKGTTNYVTLEVLRCKKMSKKCIFSL